MLRLRDLRLLSVALLAMLVLAACSSGVARTAGESVDDATITTQVKARMVENKQVDAASISVETLNGTVMLSGFAKSSLEKDAAGDIARNVKGVKAVKNEIAVRG